MRTRVQRLRAGTFIILWAALVSLDGQTAHGATYYVDRNHSSASDNNAGTEASPWASIAKGVSVAASGDTVLVKTGTYTNALRLVNSGAENAPIVFMAFPGDSPVIDGSQSALDKFIDWKGGASGGVNKNYIIFDGFLVRSCRRWAFWIEGDHNIIRHCTIRDSGPTNSGVGIIIRQGNYNVISSNEVFGSGWNGINCEDSNFTTIEYNISHDNPLHFGINVFPNTGGPQVMQTGNNIRYNILYNNMGGIYTRYQQTNEIVGNVIFKNSESGIFLHRHNLGPSTYKAYTKIYHNTIIDNGFHGIWDVNATHLIIKNNIIGYHTVQDRYYEIFVDAGQTNGHVIDYNLYYPDVAKIIYWGGSKYSLAQFQSILQQEPHGLAADPLFKDLTADDYTLLTGSAAIDNAANLAAEGCDRDLLGTPRPQGSAFDMGAFEFPVTATNVPAPPTGLRIDTGPQP